MNLSYRTGAYLPHLSRDSATYAITFRLADSLPAGYTAELRRKQYRIRDKASVTTKPLQQDHTSPEIEAKLDEGQGRSLFLRQDLAEVVANTLGYFNPERYWLHAWCVMPNHVHAVITPFSPFELPAILHTWKSFS